MLIWWSSSSPFLILAECLNKLTTDDLDVVAMEAEPSVLVGWEVARDDAAAEHLSELIADDLGVMA